MALNGFYRWSVGRGQRQRASSSQARSLLFGPRRLPPAIWLRKQTDDETAAESDRLLKELVERNHYELIDILRGYDESQDLPVIDDLVERTALVVRRGLVPSEGLTALLELLQERLDDDGSCPTLEPLAPALAAELLYHHAHPASALALARLAAYQPADHPIPRAIAEVLRAGADETASGDAPSLPELERILVALREEDDPAGLALRQQLLGDRRSWPPLIWTAEHQRELCAGQQPERLEAWAQAVRERPATLLDFRAQFGRPELAPAVRGRLERALGDYARDRAQLLGPGLGLAALSQELGLDDPGPERCRALDGQLPELSEAFSRAALDDPDFLTSRGLVADEHRRRLGQALAPQTQAALDQVCDGLAERGENDRWLRERLGRVAQHRLLRRDRSLSEVFDEQTVGRALRRALRPPVGEDDSPFVTRLNSEIFLRFLTAEAMARQGASHPDRIGDEG